MKLAKHLKQITSEDLIVQNFIENNAYTETKHSQKRCSQRAVDENMILIALVYGSVKRRGQESIHNIKDCNLRGTKFSKFIDKLRGLTVICIKKDCNYILKTVYWNDNIKHKKIYSYKKYA
jgi:hypothetical protein